MVDKNSDEFLAHYGIKGMHWGKRKAPEDSGEPKKAIVRVSGVDYDAGPTKVSADALTSAGYKARIDAGGVGALSTKELQAFVTRQNLEQQYAKLNPAPMSKGEKFMTQTLPTIVGVAQTGKATYDMFNPKAASEPTPPSTDLRVRTGQQVAKDMALHFGKQMLKEHGVTIGKQILASLI